MVLDAHHPAGTIGDFLSRLAARTATPAGGSVAALCTAQAAALVAMVARYCEDASVVSEAEAKLAQAVQLGDDDVAAFGAVADAWELPRTTPSDQEARHEAVETALLGATEPQAGLVEIAVEVLVLVDHLRPRARGGLRADLAAASEVAHAGAAIARMNVEANLRDLPASDARATLLRRISGAPEPGQTPGPSFRSEPGRP